MTVAGWKNCRLECFSFLVEDDGPAGKTAAAGRDK